jgi:enoyl-CoA hydratase/carnithine racemase
MSYETLEYETEGEVGILTYNRPKVVNAVNKQMVEELYDFWIARQRDFDTRVIIVQGAGEKGFCSGLDMKAVVTEFAPPEGATAETTFNGQIHFSVLMRLMRSCPQPIIAAIHGPAMGAGLSFALAADVRLASEDAFFCAQAGKEAWVLN